MPVSEVVQRFDLGVLVAPLWHVTSGWGRRNKMWRADTSEGSFAVKELVEPLMPDDTFAPVHIELAAFAAGVPSAEPVASRSGRWFERSGDRFYRCHRWVEGSAKANEDTNASEAARMGGLVATLHALRLPESQGAPRYEFGREHWIELAQRSRSGSVWSNLILEHLHEILLAETVGANAVSEDAIGSHRDLNAHNVLFEGDALVLVDWDAAGPISAPYETVSTATLWAQRPGGSLDRAVARSFLDGYRSAGGRIGPDDVGSVAGWLNGLAWWTERNVQIALADPSPHHDDLASGLVHALVSGPTTVALRQRFLTDVFHAW